MALRKAATLLSKPISQQFGFSGQPLVASTVGISRSRLISSSVVAEAEKAAGQVKWFNSVKGYGFIVPNDGSPDLFVHQSCILADGFRSLAEGEDVEFEVTEDNNGRLRAVNVSGPDGAQPKGQPRQPSPGFGGGSFGGGGGGGSYGGGRGGNYDY